MDMMRMLEEGDGGRCRGRGLAWRWLVATLHHTAQPTRPNRNQNNNSNPLIIITIIKHEKVGGVVSELLYSPAAYGLDMSVRNAPKPRARISPQVEWIDGEDGGGWRFLFGLLGGGAGARTALDNNARRQTNTTTTSKTKTKRKRSPSSATRSSCSAAPSRSASARSRWTTCGAWIWPSSTAGACCRATPSARRCSRRRRPRRPRRRRRAAATRRTGRATVLGGRRR